MWAKGFCLLLGIAALTGCMHNTSSDRAFTRDWSQQLEKEGEFQARQARIEGRTPANQPGNTQAPAESKDQSKSVFRLGGDTGLSAGVNASGLSPDVDVKYRVKW